MISSQCGQFTGSYSYSGFRSCIAVNPWDTRNTAKAIYQALTMDDEEAFSRWDVSKRPRPHVYYRLRDFLGLAQSCSDADCTSIRHLISHTLSAHEYRASAG
jgi:hypothetical protein